MKVLYDGEAILVGVEQVDLSQFPDLKVIGCNMTGLDHLPWDEINRRGIKIISLASPRDKETEEFLDTITSTSEHSAGLILALMRNYKTVFRGNDKRITGHTLWGKTLGLIGGGGRIGKQLCIMAESFGMNVIIYDKKY